MFEFYRDPQTEEPRKEAHMNELEIKRVPFMGTELMAARDAEGQIWAGAKILSQNKERCDIIDQG